MVVNTVLNKALRKHGLYPDDVARLKREKKLTVRYNFCNGGTQVSVDINGKPTEQYVVVNGYDIVSSD